MLTALSSLRYVLEELSARASAQFIQDRCSRLTKTTRGTCFSATVSDKKVLKASDTLES